MTGKMIRIVIDAREGDQVVLSLPMELMSVMLRSGMEIPKLRVKELDLKQIAARIRRGERGKLAELSTREGDHITVECL